MQISTIQRVAKNTAALYAALIVNALLSLLLFILIARMLGDVTLGKYAFALAFTMIFADFGILGFDTVIVRDVSRDKSLAPKYLGNIAVIKAILSVTVFGLIALIINLMHYPPDTTTAVLIIGTYIILTAFANTFRFIFRAFERMEYEALVVSISRLVGVSLGVAALFAGYGLIEIAYALLIGGILDFLLSLFICSKKFVRLKLEVDLDFWRKVAKVALPIALIDVAAIIFVRVDTVMLSVMKGDAVVGWYNAAYNLVLGLQPIPFIFGSALFPLMSRSFVSSPNSVAVIYEKALRYLFILGLPLTTGTMLLSDRIIPLFYGAGFTHSIVALQILAWNILLHFMYILLAVVLASIDRQNQMALAAGICAVLNVILNLILIPHFSYVGAGIATIITGTVLFALYFYFVRKYLYRLPLHKMVVKPIIACAIMAIFLHFVSGIHLAVLIASAIALYFLALFILRAFSGEDIRLLKQVLRR
jgi:O-antigen/teichoic acid export membrane protein